MTSKPTLPGLDPLATLSAKQTKSRKAVTNEQERAGSAGGVKLDKGTSIKTSNATKTASKASGLPATKCDAPEPTSAANKPRRKPRKLNQNSKSAPSEQIVASAPNDVTASASSEAAASELDALKARVRGLEAKVEELYKASSDPTQTARSPRRRGKGRKATSSKELPTISSTANNNTTTTTTTTEPVRVEKASDEAEEAEEELVRLEDELDSARRDVERYRPGTRRTFSGDSEDVEEIPREKGASTAERQVTLSGSYRIPMPASVSVDDVKTIQSGVSAAQNVARSFLEQRRAAAAAAALSAEQNPSSPSPSLSPSDLKQRPAPRSMASDLHVSVDEAGGKQSWGEWIGGYSMAITRAVGKIEHAAAMESQRVDQARSTNAPGMKKKPAVKRPPAKAKLSSDQVHGLMS